MANITDLETGLKQQLSDLAEQIRTAEANLLLTKEGYLKVSGALEIIEILKKEEETRNAATAAADREALTAAGLAD